MLNEKIKTPDNGVTTAEVDSNSAVSTEIKIS